eukprot:10906753-Alexandrium_andersonii.AAC.1
MRTTTAAAAAAISGGPAPCQPTASFHMYGKTYFKAIFEKIARQHEQYYRNYPCNASLQHN